MLYTVLKKWITVSIKLLIRQSMGTLAVVFDAVLDELSYQLDAALLPPATVTQETAFTNAGLVLRWHPANNRLDRGNFALGKLG